MKCSNVGKALRAEEIFTKYYLLISYLKLPTQNTFTQYLFKNNISIKISLKCQVALNNIYIMNSLGYMNTSV